VAERLGLREAFGVRPACRRFPRFMVPVHAQRRKEALLEPQPSPSSVVAKIGILLANNLRILDLDFLHYIFNQF